MRVGGAFYWPLLLSRGGHFREVSLRINVRNVAWGEKIVAVVERWPL